MDYVTLTKNVAKLAVSYGTTVIVAGIIGNNVATKTIKTKLVVLASAFVIASIIDEHTDKYVSEKVDAGAAFVTKHILPRFQK
jgi:hypothetical protein